MREILFRGKRLDNDEWVYGGFSHDVPCICRISQDDNGKEFIVNGCGHFVVKKGNVCQYTGITDKNGVKIFEGDLILIGDEKTPVCVEFIDFSWQCTCKAFGPYYRHRLEHHTEYYEVIGNIHDNPELIDKTIN